MFPKKVQKPDQFTAPKLSTQPFATDDASCLCSALDYRVNVQRLHLGYEGLHRINFDHPETFNVRRNLNTSFQPSPYSEKQPPWLGLSPYPWAQQHNATATVTGYAALLDIRNYCYNFRHPTEFLRDMLCQALHMPPLPPRLLKAFRKLNTVR